jgi:hypothetical protein
VRHITALVHLCGPAGHVLHFSVPILSPLLSKKAANPIKMGDSKSTILGQQK